MVEDNPYGLLRYGGEPLPPLYQLDGGDFVIYIGTFSKILSPGIRLGWAVAPPPVMEKIVLGKQAADLCTSTLTQYFVREYFAERRWQHYIDDLVEIYRGRRDTMLEALRTTSRRRRPGPSPTGGLFIWATLPDYIDTGDLLAKALRADVAFVPGQAAYVDGRGSQLDAAQLLRRRRGRDPRGDPADRQGDRRAGRPLRGAHRRTAAARRPSEELRPPTSSPSARRARRDEGRGPEGRSLARAWGLAALRRRGSRTRLGGSATRCCRSTSAPTWSSAWSPSAPTSPSSRCTGSAARTAPRRSCWRSSASPSPGRARRPARAAWTRSRPSTRSSSPAGKARVT